MITSDKRDVVIIGASLAGLMAAPAMLFNPSVIFSACRAAVRGMSEKIRGRGH
jgi:hypothetical protein